MSNCERCHDAGKIAGSIETLLCPNCHDGVCHWCNQRKDDGEELGETGLFVCRDCIRDMASYKENVAFQFSITTAVGEYTDAGELQDDVDAAIAEVFDAHGIDVNYPDGWTVRDDTGDKNA